jgi:hypothetical protein
MCRLGIGSEQTSDTRSSAGAAGELCKKKSGAALGAAQPTDKVHG